jgi:hypothetical protein
MYDSDRYRVEPALADAFVAGQRHGTPIAIPSGDARAADVIESYPRG